MEHGSNLIERIKTFESGLIRFYPLYPLFPRSIKVLFGSGLSGLGMEDMFLDFAGRKRAGDTVHDHLAGLWPGDSLVAVVKGNHIELHDNKGICVALHSQTAFNSWGGRMDCIERIQVLAMVQRRVEDSGEAYRSRCQCELWEVPVAEVEYLGKK